MEHRRAFITVADGTRLAAQLWLPDERPAPVVLEALPYRMDDLTSAYTRRSTSGSARRAASPSAGSTSAAPARRRESRPTSTRRAEHDDICEVIAWLAEQEWSNGRVGMYGTSWSGFNSLQVACLRPPALARDRADLRLRRPLHRRRPLHGRRAEGDRPRRLGALHGRRATRCRRCPPCSATAGASEWERRVDDAEPWLLRWFEEQVDGAVLAPRLGAAGLRPDHLPDDDRRRLGRRLHEHRLPRLRGADAARSGCSSARGGTARPPPSLPGPHIDLVPELIRWFRRWLARRGERRRRGAADRGVRPPLDPAGA